MPIYEYRCQSCGHELEKLQRMSDPVLTDCPECGKSKLRRLISAAGFRLKGAGWYETDFKQGNKRNLAESLGGSEGASAKESTGGNGSAAKTDSTGSKSDGAAKPASSSGGSDGSPGATSKKKTGSGGTADAV